MSEVPTEIPDTLSETTEPTLEIDPATKVLQQQLDVLYARTEEETDALLSTMQNELWHNFELAWKTASESHSQLSGSLINSETSNAPLSWKQIVQYRRDVHRFIFLKILSSLMPSVFSRVESYLQNYFSRLHAIESELSILVQIPENPDLFTPHPSDSTGTRYRKWVRRRRQRTRAFIHGFNNVLRRITFRKPKDPAQRTQNIPFRHLASYHLTVRIPESIQPAIQAFHQALTDQLARFEHAQTSWLHALLEVDHKYYEPSHVLDAPILWSTDVPNNFTEYVDTTDQERIHTQAQQLEAALDFESTGWETFSQSVKESIQKSFEMMLYDTQRGGTILLSTVERPVPDSTFRSGLNPNWRLWHEEVLHRVQMNNELLKFRDRLLSSNQGLIRNIHQVCLSPVIHSYNSLHERISDSQIKVEEFCTAAKETGDIKQLGKSLSTVRTALINDFKSVLENVHVLVKTGKALEDTGETGWVELNRYVENVEKTLSVHNPLPSSPAIEKIQKGRYEVLLGELIREAVAESRSDRLSSISTDLRKAIFKAWGDIQEVQNIVDFNLTAAVSELTERDTKPKESEEANEEEPVLLANPLLDAEKLINEALNRSKENLLELQSELRSPWAVFIQECFKQTNRYWRTIKEDLRSQDQIHTWLENARIYSSRAVSRTVTNLQNTGAYTVQWLGRSVRKARALLSRLVRKGRSAVGVIEQSEEGWLQTLNRVSNIHSLHGSLPLIYQRLFSPNPLVEIDLIEGRKKDLDFIGNHYDRWLNGQVGPLVLSMVEGSGRTSLMNVLEHSTFKEASVKRIVYTERITETASWAERIGTALQIAPVKSLEHLESQLVPLSRSKEPDVIILDQFEHLLLCTPGGDDIIERILIFMSRTDHVIYWIANINKHAWHYLENTIHPSFGFITSYTNSTISREAMEDLILKRHNRSGLTLRFDSSIRSSNLLQLSRRRDDKSKQRDLRRTFFDRLYKHSGENIRLAILYWLQSLRYDKTEDTLHVHNINPINFAFLDTLDQKRAFTLKSFMIHGTLTLAEHMRLFNMSQTESTFIMESLLNLHIIEQTGKKGDPSQQVHILPDASYRLHSLIRHPVSEYLSREHIIY